jgi:transposase, IS5 family
MDNVSENIYMQYFLGYSGFTSQPPFDASLFVEFRKWLGMEQINAITERIITL